MALLTVKLDKDNKAIEYMKATSKRLENNNIVQNPFIGKIRPVNTKDSLIYIIQTEPVYPKVYYFTSLIVIGTALFNLTVAISFAIVTLILYFMWSKYLIYISVRLGLKRIGYSGNISILSNKETIGLFML